MTMTIPRKPWGRILDLKIEHDDMRTAEAQDALIQLQEEYNFPWSLSEEQNQEWSELCRRLDPEPPETIFQALGVPASYLTPSPSCQDEREGNVGGDSAAYEHDLARTPPTDADFLI